jgi:hypothetical protein
MIPPAARREVVTRKGICLRDTMLGYRTRLAGGTTDTRLAWSTCKTGNAIPDAASGEYHVNQQG